MSRFTDTLRSGRVLLMDGAMGTELQRAGIRPGECYELWNLTHPDWVRAIHQAYVSAGARCLLTNTFQAQPPALAEHGLQERLAEINAAAVAIARSACGSAGFVLASIGPSSQPLSPTHWAQLVRSLHAADGLLLETWSDLRGLTALQELRRANEELAALPVLCSLTYRRETSGELRTLEGLAPEAIAGLVRDSGIAALGVNCGRDLGMDEISAILRRYRRATDLPLFARPNAGTPARRGDCWVYPQTPAYMADRLPELLAAGLAMVGGCCGTTPEHIAAFRSVVEAWNGRRG
jgi:5-methyltetrahydrofolate--homocysteine methyltransferase